MKKVTFLLLLMLLSGVLLPIGCTKTTFALTINANGQGAVVPPVGAYTFEGGKTVTLTAFPAKGWKFDSWVGDTSDTAVRINVNMDRPRNIIANFSRTSDTLHALTITIEGDGSTTPSAGRHFYSNGSVITIASDPSVGSQFDRWSGQVASATSATTVVNMNQDISVTAYFNKKPIVFGPETRNIGTGNGIWKIPLNSGDQFKLEFTVSGAEVTYAVRDPNNKTVLTSPSKERIGQFTFAATISGDYQITFVSQSKATSSVLTVSYAIYPKR